MSVLLKRYTRQLHRALAPIMLFPLLLTLTTGLLFQVAVLNGKETDFLWLLDLHRGKFGSINLETVYVFFNALGLLFLGVTGLIMWFQIGRSTSGRSNQ